jgi:hypothetical protein
VGLEIYMQRYTHSILKMVVDDDGKFVDYDNYLSEIKQVTDLAADRLSLLHQRNEECTLLKLKISTMYEEQQSTYRELINCRWGNEHAVDTVNNYRMMVWSILSGGLAVGLLYLTIAYGGIMNVFFN